MLADEEINAFFTQGYCVARVSLPEGVVERAINTVWALCPTSFDRHAPDTWQGEFRDCCKTQSIDERRGRVKFRECLRDQRWLYDLSAGNTEILEAVGDLIGEPVPPQYVRGLYPVFRTTRRPPEGHCDQHKFQVGVVLYLSHVFPHGGGFTVWPASHHEMAKHHGSLGGKDRLRTFNKAVARVEASTRPIEVTGPPGTVVFWHHRLVHTAGINTLPQVRHATLCDFKNERFLAAADDKTRGLWETWSPRVRQFASTRGKAGAKVRRWI